MILNNTIRVISYAGRKSLQVVSTVTPSIRKGTVKVVNAARKESALASIEAKTQRKLIINEYNKCKKKLSEEREAFIEGINAKLVLPGMQPQTA